MLQSWLHTRWPTPKQPPVVTTVDHSKRPKPPHMPNSPVTCEAKVSVLEDVLLEGKVTDCEFKVPASGAGALVIALDVLPPSLPYNPSRCDHDCPLCERQFLVGAACRKSLAKHVRDKHEPNLNPNHPRFLVWMEASERCWCLDCGFSYSRRCSHKCKGPRATPEVSSPSLVCTPVADSEVKVVGACVLPGLLETFATSIPSVKRIPQQCRVLVAKAFTTLMRNCCVSSTKEQEVRAWKLLFLFPKCVLRLQPEIRGGKRKKLKRNETLRTGLLERLKRWNEGQVDVLWAEARKLFSGGERQAVTVSLANNIRRATECAQDARYGKAVASLLSALSWPVSHQR